MIILVNEFDLKYQNCMTYLYVQICTADNGMLLLPIVCVHITSVCLYALYLYTHLLHTINTLMNVPKFTSPKIKL